MEINLPRYTRNPHPHLAKYLRQRRSGYEPSDTETSWQESPWGDSIQQPAMVMDSARKISPLRHGTGHPSKWDDSDSLSHENPETGQMWRRNTNKSPYQARRRDGNPALSTSNQRNISPLNTDDPDRQDSPFKARRDDGVAVPTTRVQRNVSPLERSDLAGRLVSPHKPGRKELETQDNDDIAVPNRRRNSKTPNREERISHSQFGEGGRVGDRSPFGRRAATAPRQRTREKDQENSNDYRDQNGERNALPYSRGLRNKQREGEVPNGKTSSVGEINEMVANMKISRGGGVFNARDFESTESISRGDDIFFSRDQPAVQAQKTALPKIDDDGPTIYPRQVRYPQRDSVLHRSKTNTNVEYNQPRMTSSDSRTTTNSTSASSRHTSSGFASGECSKVSDASSKSTESSKRFAVSRRKSQSDAWFSCMKRKPCKTTESSEKQHLDEASFIKRANVPENLRQFWADKHQPSSLTGFTCHKQEAQILNQLVSYDIIPHIVLKGPYGSGKRSLARALVSEIFGDGNLNMSHDLRYFNVQDKNGTHVVLPVTSSAHHVELNVNTQPNAKHALLGLVKEISISSAITPELSTISPKPDYKVMILYEVDKATENVQHLIKWIMDCYTDACKLVLCCEDDIDIVESVRNRCKLVKVDAPVTHEIMEVLIQIAKKEDIELPMSFAAKIATKSKQNMRKAIMALEACKAHNYPFVDDQPIPLGWEEVLVELASDILADPSPKRLFYVRGKLQKLLVDFVDPRLILLKLVEEFIKGVEDNSKRELHYWHAYYEKRLPTGTTALLKLEANHALLPAEFAAKIMSIHRKTSQNRPSTTDDF